MKKLFVFATLILCAGIVFSQVPKNSNAVTALPKANDIANHLRVNYGMTKAVYLTQMAWKLSHSFASTDQLTQQWQQAIETEVQEYQQFHHINSHALMAQVLIQYTNGMSLNQWRFDELITPPQLPAFSEGLTPDEVFQAWVNFPYFWQKIIALQNEQNNQWLNFPGLVVNSGTMKKPFNKDQVAITQVLNGLAKTNGDVSTLLYQTDQTINQYDKLSVAILRQHQHAQQNKLLAYAYDWIEIYQLLELSSDLLAAEDQKNFKLITDQALVLWQAHLNDINAIDVRMHPMITTILLELPNKFKDPDHLLPELNKSIFALLLNIPAMDSYMNHPIRKKIHESLEVCLNLSASQSPEPNVPIEDNQFESCFNDFINWATKSATNDSFTGGKIRPDNAISLHRALDLPAIQITNILAIYTNNEASCQQQLTAHSNIFEWLLASDSLVWFHNRWPGIFAAKDKNAYFAQLIKQGFNTSQYPSCFTQAQPLLKNFNLLKNKWSKLKQEITNQANDYAKNELTPNNDINLFGSTEQKTNHVPLGLMVKPCDISQSCAAKIELTTGPELMNLFPNHLKLANQFGLGELAICYDQVSWQNRKTTPTHLDNNKIANFEGQLGIQLNGFYANKKVFTTQLLSEQRHVYLFGENNESTLDMACPLPIIGKQINTTLDRGTFGLLPNRLTFLTAQKADVNTVIKSNWQAWLTGLTSAQTHVDYLDEQNGVKTNLNDVFLYHVNIIQQQIYRKLITSNPSRINDSALSKATFEFLNQRNLLQKLIAGLFPNTYHANSEIRSALTGNQRLIDGEFFKTTYDSQLNVMEMMNLADEKFLRHDEIWSKEAIQNTGPEYSFINDTLDELKHINSSNVTNDLD